MSVALSRYCFNPTGEGAEVLGSRRHALSREYEGGTSYDAAGTLLEGCLVRRDARSSARDSVHPRTRGTFSMRSTPTVDPHDFRDAAVGRSSSLQRQFGADVTLRRAVWTQRSAIDSHGRAGYLAANRELGGPVLRNRCDATRAAPDRGTTALPAAVLTQDVLHQ